MLKTLMIFKYFHLIEMIENFNESFKNKLKIYNPTIVGHSLCLHTLMPLLFEIVGIKQSAHWNSRNQYIQLRALCSQREWSMKLNKQELSDS